MRRIARILRSSVSFSGAARRAASGRSSTPGVSHNGDDFPRIIGMLLLCVSGETAEAGLTVSDLSSVHQELVTAHHVAVVRGDPDVSELEALLFRVHSLLDPVVT